MALTFDRALAAKLRNATEGNGFIRADEGGDAGDYRRCGPTFFSSRATSSGSMKP